MKLHKFRLPLIILAVYLLATAALLLLGYRVEAPAVQQAEFPYSITYSLQGEEATLRGVFLCRCLSRPKYLGESNLGFDGYIKDHDDAHRDFYRVLETPEGSFCINLNLDPQYLLGAAPAPREDLAMVPTGVWNAADDTRVEDPAALEAMGFRLLSWEYPQPLENRFVFSGFALSSEASLLCGLLALAALLACLILVRRDRARPFRTLDRVSAVLGILLLVLFYPFVQVVAMLSELVPTSPVIDTAFYLLPALTLLGIAVSLVFRRRGFHKTGLLAQLAGPALLGLILLADRLF